LREVVPRPDPANFPAPPEGMVFVPEGKFLMGIEWGEDNTAMPARLIQVDSFFIDKREVTVAAYREFMKKRFRGRVPFYLRDKDLGGDNQPAFKVSWQDANDFCVSIEKRLPTEAEWEKAARGWDNRLFPWGNELPEKDGKYKANFNPGRKFEDGYLYTADTGSFSNGISPYGVLDLSGNVWEWTSDWYDPDIYKSGSTDNPKGPAEGKEKVIRGGGYNTPLKRLLLTTRLKERPKMRRGYLGFRCVKPLGRKG
ncbi:MAG: formylglycine-generating enzyme family protein, partial [Nitrospinota bacterium]